MSLVVAFAFECDKSLPQMLDALRAGTTWQWYERDSDLWDEYLSAQASPNQLSVKVFTEENRYLLEFKCLTPEAEARWEELTQTALGKLVPLLGAREVRRAPANN